MIFFQQVHTIYYQFNIILCCLRLFLYSSDKESIKFLQIRFVGDVETPKTHPLVIPLWSHNRQDHIYIRAIWHVKKFGLYHPTYSSTQPQQVLSNYLPIFNRHATSRMACTLIFLPHFKKSSIVIASTFVTGIIVFVNIFFFFFSVITYRRVIHYACAVFYFKISVFIRQEQSLKRNW